MSSIALEPTDLDASAWGAAPSAPKIDVTAIYPAWMEPRPTTLRLYGVPSEGRSLEWQWVDQQLASAGTYWIVARTSGQPHPRPVWGAWCDHRLYLSIGSPALRTALLADPAATVHLDSGTDVVIVEGRARVSGSTTATAIQAYNGKYTWDYQVGDYGELTVVQPRRILAWRTAGWAGRDSFQETGCWQFDDQD